MCLAFQAPIADDFNGDGKTDVVLRTSNRAISERQGSDCSLQPLTAGSTSPISYHPSVVAPAMATGDFNHDGLPDIVSLNNIGRLTIVSAQSGGFDAPRGFRFTLRPASCFQQFSVGDLKSGDLNGDGALDLVVAASGLSDAAIMFGDGHGAFNAPVSINSGVTVAPRSPSKFAISTTTAGRTWRCSTPTHETSWSCWTTDRADLCPAARINVGVNATGLVSADFNNDGNLDIVVRGESSGLALYFGDGGARFHSERHWNRR